MKLYLRPNAKPEWFDFCMYTHRPLNSRPLFHKRNLSSMSSFSVSATILKIWSVNGAPLVAMSWETTSSTMITMNSKNSLDNTTTTNKHHHHHHHHHLCLQSLVSHSWGWTWYELLPLFSILRFSFLMSSSTTLLQVFFGLPILAFYLPSPAPMLS